MDLRLHAPRSATLIFRNSPAKKRYDVMTAGELYMLINLFSIYYTHRNGCDCFAITRRPLLTPHTGICTRRAYVVDTTKLTCPHKKKERNTEKTFSVFNNILLKKKKISNKKNRIRIKAA